MFGTHFSWKRVGRGVLLLAAVLGTLVTVATSVRAQTLTTLYSFAGGTDGVWPEAGLVMDEQGNLYGTTVGGGASGAGTVFELSPSGRETVLYPFTGPDGASPMVDLIMDKQGNLYGTTLKGGAYNAGTVFMVTPSGTETALHSFTGGADGGWPLGGVIFDTQGNLYGTTDGGGASGWGTVFELSPSGTETVLHNFSFQPSIISTRDGQSPISAVFDPRGNLYGTTLQGGAWGTGTIFKVTPGKRQWSTIFCNLEWLNGHYSGVVFGPQGNLYGTTDTGGAYGEGTVVMVTPSCTETVLHSFTGGADGRLPYGGVIFDMQGNLYGTTRGGGAYNGGTVFELTPSGTEMVLYSFTWGADGGSPFGGVIFDTQGNLYGTTSVGGAYGWGTVFKLTP